MLCSFTIIALKIVTCNNLEHGSHFSSNTFAARLKNNLCHIFHTVYFLWLTSFLPIHIICRYHVCCSNSTPAPKGLMSQVSERTTTSSTLIISNCLQRAISPKVVSPYLNLGQPKVLSRHYGICCRHC